MSATPWIEGYIWSDGTATQPVLAQRIKMVEGATTSDHYLTGPKRLSEALDEWVTAWSLTLASSYSWAWNRATNRISITVDAGPATITTYNAAAPVLGWAYGSGSSTGSAFESTTAPAAICPLVGVQVEAISDAGELKLLEFRSGRSTATYYSNKDLVRVQVLVESSNASALRGYCSTGRVRVHLDGTAAAHSSAQAGGYVDGYVVACRLAESIGATEQYQRFELDIARAIS